MLNKQFDFPTWEHLCDNFVSPLLDINQVERFPFSVKELGDGHITAKTFDGCEFESAVINIPCLVQRKRFVDKTNFHAVLCWTLN